MRKPEPFEAACIVMVVSLFFLAVFTFFFVTY